MKTCEYCPDRDNCKELCAEMEKYVNQDRVAQKELLLPNIEYVELYIEHSFEKPIHITPKEKKILLLLKNNISHDEICDILSITMNCLHTHLYNIRKKH